ncbi:MAG: hypothetical protein WDN08_05535 [Rhizomicrobium sp.]
MSDPTKPAPTPEETARAALAAIAAVKQELGEDRHLHMRRTLEIAAILVGANSSIILSR